ncbi:MAG: 1-pyrroline-5-carboxylate dehydrogenase [Patiriisocius sp.]|jgi:1-pyrroline-5-carboxylate dehydrogenase
MPKGVYQIPLRSNEPVKSYAPGSPERESLQATYDKMYNQKPIDVPMYIGGKKIKTKKKVRMSCPHDHKHTLGYFNEGGKAEVTKAIDAALKAKEDWANMPWESRAAIFLKAADLLAGPYRYRMNAATMLCQGKNCFQAEIDAACELIDFLNYNVAFMQEIYENQPESGEGIWNRMEYRPLEGFTFAVTPFNFTAIAANLPASMAMMGNTVVWKPADSQVYSANVIMELFMEAGLPDGVINMVTADGPTVGKEVFAHRDFAGVHFTGSTGVFKSFWKIIGNNMDNYRTFPRIVGETGGKDFILAHHSANADQVATAISRGSFEFQGQKCSASSRVYLPDNISDRVIKKVVQQVSSFKMGPPSDFGNFINAVIDEKAFDKISGFIKYAKKSKNAKIVQGGGFSKEKGYFIEPTVIVTTDAKFRTMCEEIFGPVVTIFVYKKNDFEKTLKILDETSDYALTGAVLSKDRYAIDIATKALANAAGNFYINDKPTGAVVGQQPFGGARGSGTNDKAGSYLNLLRWVSPRTIKETFVTPTDYTYPFLG